MPQRLIFDVTVRENGRPVNVRGCAAGKKKIPSNFSSGTSVSSVVGVEIIIEVPLHIHLAIYTYIYQFSQSTFKT